MKIDEIEKLNAERSHGDYKSEGNELSLADHYTVAGFVDEDSKFLAAAPAITEQYIKARRFEVTEEFEHKVYAKEREIMARNKGSSLANNKLRLQAALETMWEIIENE